MQDFRLLRAHVSTVLISGPEEAVRVRMSLRKNHKAREQLGGQCSAECERLLEQVPSLGGVGSEARQRLVWHLARELKEKVERV